MSFLNVLKTLKKVIKIFKFWCTNFIVHIPSHTRISINVKLLVICRSIVVHFKRYSIDAITIADLLVECFDLALELPKIWIVLNCSLKVLNKTRVYTLRCISVIKDDKISKITSCTTCLVKSCAITRNLRCDDVKVHVELILNNLAIPTRLNTLEVSCYVVELNSIFFIMACCKLSACSTRRFCLVLTR